MDNATARKSLVVHPGQSLDLNLDIKDGEAILIIKREADGNIKIPFFAGTNNTNPQEATEEAYNLCKQVLAAFYRN